MNAALLLTVVALIGGHDDPVELWSGAFDKVQIRLLARQRAEVRRPYDPQTDTPGGVMPSLTVFWLEAQLPGETGFKCMWSQLACRSPLEAVVHLKKDGTLGVAYFNTPITAALSNSVVVRTIDLNRILTDPQEECPMNLTDVSARGWGSAKLRSFHPLLLINAQLREKARKYGGYEPALQTLTFADGKWRVTMCLSGDAFDFVRTREEWVVVANADISCRDVPPFKVPVPNVPELPSIYSPPGDSSFGGNGERFGAPPKPPANAESGDEER